MPLAIVWTPSRDTALRRLREEGASWDGVAHALGVSRNTALERGRHVGLLSGGGARPRATHAPTPIAPARPVVPSDQRLPLPAGHPHSWGAITAGTLLDGAPYPVWSLDVVAASGTRTPARSNSGDPLAAAAIA